MITSTGCKARLCCETATSTEIEMTSVALCFRKYGDVAPTLKQAVLDRLLGRSHRRSSDFQLFDDFSLRIAHGERVGIIGSNGAGKSTLLKLIAGVYRSMRGNVRVIGRIAPLIEIGTGMNAELSGEENIFLMGALLGFSPAVMAEKLEEILRFAGVGEFRHTPMKYYSQGMRLRLAFAVATDVQPEIILSDELFAGGDAEFVRRASERIRRMWDVSHIGVFVSHRLPLVQELTERAIWIERGKIMCDSDTRYVCKQYKAFQKKKQEEGRSASLDVA